MNKRKTVWFVAALIMIIACIGVLMSVGSTYTAAIDQAMVMQKVDAKIAGGVSKHGVTVTAAAVVLNASDAEVSFSMSGTKFRQTFELSAGGVGTPSFHDGAFYVVPSQIKVIDFTFKGEAPADKAKRLAQKYLKGTKIGQVVEDNADNIEEWVKTRAEDVAMHMLATTPVYRLKSDFKGIIIKAALRRVWIENQVLYAELSLWHLTATVLLWFGLMLVAVILAFGLMLSLGGVLRQSRWVHLARKAPSLITTPGLRSGGVLLPFRGFLVTLSRHVKYRSIPQGTGPLRRRRSFCLWQEPPSSVGRAVYLRNQEQERYF